MIYVLHDRSGNSGVPRTAEEALEIIKLPWPTNPYALVAAVNVNLIASAYAYTCAGWDPWPAEIVAHDLTRGTLIGDIILDTDGQACVVGPNGRPGEGVMFLRMGMILVISLPDGYYNRLNKADLSRYRSTYQRILP